MQNDETVEGWLLKQGAKGLLKGYKKRWFTLQGSRLHYFQNKGDPQNQSLGYIDILTASAIVPSFPTPTSTNSSTKGAANCEFQVVTPQRNFALVAASEQEMKQWVVALDAHRQRLIRQSREGPEAANLRRGSVGSLPPSSRPSSSSFAGASTVGAGRPQPPARRAIHTMTPQQGRQFEIGRRSTTTGADPTAPPPPASASSSSPPPVSPSALLSSSTPSAVSRELRGLSLQSGSNRRSALASSQTLLAMDDVVATISGGAGGGVGGGGLSVGDGGEGDHTTEGENKRLQLKIAELEKDLDEREEMLKELKQEIVKDLRLLNEKHRQRDDEMRQLRDELAFAREKLAEITPKPKNENGSESESASAAAAPVEWTAGVVVVGGTAAAGDDDKDAIIREQQKQIEGLKAQLQERIEEEAVKMKEKVRFAIEKLKQEQEEQIRKLSQQKVGQALDGDATSNEQLRKENALLREEVKRVVEKMDALVRKGHQLLLEIVGRVDDVSANLKEEEEQADDLSATINSLASKYCAGIVDISPPQEGERDDPRDAEIQWLRRELLRRETEMAEKDSLLAERDAHIARLTGVSANVPQPVIHTTEAEQNDDVSTIPTASADQKNDATTKVEERSGSAVPVMVYRGRKVTLSVPDPGDEDDDIAMRSAEEDEEGDDDDDSMSDGKESDSSESESESDGSSSSAEEDAEDDNLLRAEALYDFAARNENEISFAKGETLIVYDKDTSGWWKAEVKRKKRKGEGVGSTGTGLVPSNYLRVLYKPPTFNFKLSSKVNRSILELQKKCGFVTPNKSAEKKKKQRRTSSNKSDRRRSRGRRAARKSTRGSAQKDDREARAETIASIQKRLFEQKGFLAKQKELLMARSAAVDNNNAADVAELSTVGRVPDDRGDVGEGRSSTSSAAALVHLTLSRPAFSGKRRPSRRNVYRKGGVYAKADAGDDVSTTEEKDPSEDLAHLVDELDAIVSGMASFEVDINSEPERRDVDSDRERLKETEKEEEKKVEQEKEDRSEKQGNEDGRDGGEEEEGEEGEEGGEEEEEESKEANQQRTEEMVRELKWRLDRAEEVIEANRMELEMAKEKEMILRLEMRSLSLEASTKQAETELEKERAAELAGKVEVLTEAVREKEAEIVLWRQSSRQSVRGAVASTLVPAAQIAASAGSKNESDEAKSEETKTKNEEEKNEDEKDEGKAKEKNEAADNVDAERLMAEIMARNRRVEELEEEVRERGDIIEKLMMEVRAREEEKEVEREQALLEREVDQGWWESERKRLLDMIDAPASSASSSSSSSSTTAPPPVSDTSASSASSSVVAAEEDERSVATTEKNEAENAKSDGGGPMLELEALKKKAQRLEEEKAARKEEEHIGEELIRLQAQLIETAVTMLASSSAPDPDPAVKQRQAEEVRELLEELDYLTQKRAVLVAARKEMVKATIGATRVSGATANSLSLSSVDSRAARRTTTMVALTNKPSGVGGGGGNGGAGELTRSQKRRMMFPAGTEPPPLPSLPSTSSSSSSSASASTTAVSTGAGTKEAADVDSKSNVSPSTKAEERSARGNPEVGRRPAQHHSGSNVLLPDSPLLRRAKEEKKIKKQIEKMAKKKMEGREALVEAGPEWLPDVMVPVCFGCRATFTLIKRRHHCRNCGKVYCGKCTSVSCSIEELGYTEPVRVCDQCFESLHTRNSSYVKPTPPKGKGTKPSES